MGDWGDLNKRQQTYLRAIYDLDQEAEALEKSKWARGGRARPAEEWRWIFYGIFESGDDSPLRTRLKRAKLVDEGTGSTFQALETRGFILCRYHPAVDEWLDVQITKAGRKLVRAATGEIREHVKPGTLREWQWAALAKAYDAGENGVETFGGSTGDVSWETWRRLRDYAEDALVEEKMRAPVSGFGSSYNIAITAFGQWYYAANYEHYRALYPNVKAKKPRRQHPKPEVIQERPMPKRIMVKAAVLGDIVSHETKRPLGDRDPRLKRTVGLLQHPWHLGAATTAEVEHGHDMVVAVASSEDLARWVVDAINATLDAAPAVFIAPRRPAGTFAAPWDGGEVAHIYPMSHHYNRLGREVKHNGVSHTHFVLVTVVNAHWRNPLVSEERGGVVAQLPSEQEAQDLATRLSALLQ
jgi:hypothetical protein